MFVIAFAIAIISIQVVYAAATNTTFPGDEFRETAMISMPIKDEIDFIMQYCSSADKGEEDITTDLVNTGKLSTFFTGYTCDKAGEDKKKVYHATEKLGEVAEDFKTLRKLEELDKID